MGGVVAPAIGIGRQGRRPASPDIVAVDVVVAVDVDVDVASTPIATAPAPERSDDGDASRKGHACEECLTRVVVRAGRIVVGRIGGIGPAAIDDGGIVGRYVDHLRIGRLDHDRLGLGVGRDNLLLRRLQLIRRLRPLAKPLNRGHHILLLSQNRITELLRPIELLAHHLQHLGEGYQGLYARVPGLLLQRRSELFALQRGVLRVFRPTLRLDNLQRIGGSHQYRGQEIVGIEGDRSQDLVELFRLEHGSGLGRRHLGCGRRGRRALRQALPWRQQQRGANPKNHTEFALSHFPRARSRQALACRPRQSRHRSS